MVTATEIENRVKKQPFVPLRVVTSSGEAFEVRHPDLIMIGRRELVIGLAGKKNPKHFEQLARVAIMHVTTLEDLRPKSKSQSDGQH